MSIFKEIQKQPEHIREIFMWLCALIIFSFILLAGLRQTERRLVALVNQELEESASQLARKNEGSPLGALGGYFTELKASIGDVFNLNFGHSAQEIKNSTYGEKIPPALLPLAGDK